jgi:putative flippase GtrA
MVKLSDVSSLRSIDDLKQFVAAFIRSEFFRFLVVGAINTAASYGIYVLVSLVAHYIVAYTVSTVTGIAISYVLNALYVYKTKLSLARAAAYPLVYGVQYGLGVGLLYLMVDQLGVSHYIAPLIIVVATIPVTFLLSRLIVKQRVPSESLSE